eukprot:1559080-Rhodomonas_salina.4
MAGDGDPSVELQQERGRHVPRRAAPPCLPRRETRHAALRGHAPASSGSHSPLVRSLAACVCRS